MIEPQTQNLLQKWIQYGSMQLMSILFSFVSVFIKFASLSMAQNGLFSIKTISFIAAYIFILCIYAFFWQKIIKLTSLSTAYMSKSSLLLWTLLWSILFFGEHFTLYNALGILFIIAGTILVNSYE